MGRSTTIPAILGEERARSIKAVQYQESLEYRSGWPAPEELRDEIALDTETVGLDPREDRCVAVSMSQAPNQAYVISAKDAAKMSAPKAKIIGHNLQFDIPVLRGIGWSDLDVSFDTMIAAHVLGKDRVGLKRRSEPDLGIRMQNIDDLLHKGKHTMEDVPEELRTHYAGADADVTYQLKQQYQAELDEDPDLQTVFDLDMAVMPMLVRMSDVGVSVDSDYLRAMADDIQIEIDRLYREIQYCSGKPGFNPDSPAQLSDLLYTQLGIEPLRSTDTPGQFSTARDLLEEQILEHPIVETIIEYRRLGTLQRTFVKKLPGIVNQRTNRIHCSWNLARVVTGRLSSDGPNLQNIPIRGKIGDKIRAGFIPAPGNVIVGGDFKGIELRVLAHFTKDARLCQMIIDGVDPHAWLTNYIFDLGKEADLASVPKDLRDVSKNSFFCIAYRGSKYALSKLLRPALARHAAIELCEKRGRRPGWDPYITLADLIIEGIYSGFPELGSWQEREIEACRVRGYTQSIKGRRRKLFNLDSPSPKAQAADEHVASNHCIQATAGSDIMKSAMKELWEAFGQEDWFKPVLQIHDENQIEVPKEHGEFMKMSMEEIMPTAMKLDVPLEVDVKIGASWAETH